MELLGSTGAAVLGAGVGLLFREVLAQFTIPLLGVGLLAHGIGMYGKHQLDTAQVAPTGRWVQWAYRLCWILLAGLLMYVVWSNV
jgi:hypothetical protein